MIFQETFERVLDGSKTQTRRAVKPNECLHLRYPPGQQPRMIAEVVGANRIKWSEGQTYAVQPGRGKHAIAHITITAIRYCARAGDISEQDAHAEGFETPEQFRAVYADLNGNDSLDQPCWALTFVLVERVNRLDEVFGKWPGDEDEAALLAQLRALDGKE